MSAWNSSRDACGLTRVARRGRFSASQGVSPLVNAYPGCRCGDLGSRLSLRVGAGGVYHYFSRGPNILYWPCIFRDRPAVCSTARAGRLLGGVARPESSSSAVDVVAVCAGARNGRARLVRGAHMENGTWKPRWEVWRQTSGRAYAAAGFDSEASRQPPAHLSLVYLRV